MNGGDLRTVAIIQDMLDALKVDRNVTSILSSTDAGKNNNSSSNVEFLAEVEVHGVPLALLVHLAAVCLLTVLKVGCKVDD